MVEVISIHPHTFFPLRECLNGVIYCIAPLLQIQGMICNHKLLGVLNFLASKFNST